MPSGIKFLEKALDQLGLKEDAKKFPEEKNIIKDVRNLLRFDEIDMGDDEWLVTVIEQGFEKVKDGVRTRFSDIENLPDKVKKVDDRIDDSMWEEYE
jgi:hypothetical protein